MLNEFVESGSDARQFRNRVAWCYDRAQQDASDFHLRLSALQARNSGIRAEVRCNFSDMSSALILLDALLKSNAVAEHAIVLPMPLVIKWIGYLQSLLSKPIFKSLVALMGADQDMTGFLLCKKAIPTVALFESLLTSTLFSGRTLGYCGPFVWGRQERSLDMMRSIIDYQQPSFSNAAVWSPEDMMFATFGEDDSDVFDFLASKMKTKRGDIGSIIQVIQKLKGDLQAPVKAKFLIERYFKDLPSECFRNVTRWKMASLADGVPVLVTPKPLSIAIKSVFDSQKSPLTAWRRPFMYGYDLFVNIVGSENRAIKLIEDAAVEMDIECLHYAGNRDFFLKARTFIKVLDPSQIAMNEDARRPLSIMRPQPVAQPRRAKIEFKPDEDDDLVEGLNDYLERGDKQLYAKLLRDPRYCFSRDGIRDNVALKDRVRTLKRQGRITVDLQGRLVWKSNKRVKLVIETVPASLFLQQARTATVAAPTTSVTAPATAAADSAPLNASDGNTDQHHPSQISASSDSESDESDLPEGPLLQRLTLAAISQPQESAVSGGLSLESLVTEVLIEDRAVQRFLNVYRNNRQFASVDGITWTDLIKSGFSSSERPPAELSNRLKQRLVDAGLAIDTGIRARIRRP